METLALLFVFGSVGFGILSLLMFLLILALTENNHNIWAGLFIMIFAVIVNSVNPLIMSFSIYTILISTLGYFIIGGCWSFVKWFNLVKRKLTKYSELKDEWIIIFNKSNPDNILKLNTQTNITAVLGPVAASTFEKYLVLNGYSQPHHGLDIVPLAANNKEKLVNWIIFWPTSLVWTAINEPIAKIATWMYNKFSNVYTNISRSIFGNVGVEDSKV